MEDFANSKREMRFLLTQRCCYKCVFCHGEGLQSLKSDSFNVDDWNFLFTIGKKYFGMKTSTLTGGEPLMRNDVIEIAKKLKQSGSETTLTTNAFLLAERLEIGEFLDKVNISFHVADKDKYEQIVARPDSYERAKDGIRTLRAKYPNLKIVLNSTCVDGLNYTLEDTRNLVDFAKEINASIKVLELYPPLSKGFVPLQDIAFVFEKLGFQFTEESLRKWTMFDGQTKVSISKIFCALAAGSDNPGDFCRDYNDLFVSPDGKIKPCRNNPREIDVLEEVKLRNEDGVKDKLQKAFDMLGFKCNYYIKKDFTK